MVRKVQSKVSDSEYLMLEQLANAASQTVSAWVYCAIQDKARKAGLKLPKKRKYIKKVIQ